MNLSKLSLVCNKIMMLICISLPPTIIYADIETGLVADFSFSGHPNDISDSGYIASVFGARLTEDRFGNIESAYAFSDNQSINTNLNGEKFTNAMSISFWMKTSDANRHPNGFFNCHNTAYLISTFASEGDGHSFNYCIDNNKADDLSLNLALYDNIWHHIVLVEDSQLHVVYLDGIIYNSKDVVNTFEFKGSLFKFGKQRPNSSAYYNGTLDDIKIYNRALTDNDVLELFRDTSAASFNLAADCNKDQTNNILDVICIINVINSHSVQSKGSQSKGSE